MAPHRAVMAPFLRPGTRARTRMVAVVLSPPPPSLVGAEAEARVGAVALVLRGDAALHVPGCPPRVTPRCLLARSTIQSGGGAGCDTSDRPAGFSLVERGRCEHWLFIVSQRCPFSSRLPLGHAEHPGLCDPRGLSSSGQVRVVTAQALPEGAAGDVARAGARRQDPADRECPSQNRDAQGIPEFSKGGGMAAKWSPARAAASSAPSAHPHPSRDAHVRFRPAPTRTSDHGRSRPRPRVTSWPH